MTLDLAGAGRLLRYGLEPRLTPARNRDYHELVVAALNDHEFGAAFRALAEGAGLDVVGIDPLLGVTLAAGGLPGAPEESPFAMRLADYARRENEDRLLHALVHLAIAATAYPTAESLEEDRLPTTSVGEVVDVTVHLIERLRERLGPGDPPEDEPGMEPLYRFVSRYPVTKTTGDLRAHQRTLTGAVSRAFQWLADQGFADRVERADVPDAYRMRARYRLHVRDAAAYVGTELDRIREEAAS